MICKRAEFVDFRNLRKETVKFTPGLNVIWGENAQGKSNILEGIYFFARGRSFRTAFDKDMVNEDSQFADFGLTIKRKKDKHVIKLDTMMPREGRRVFYKNGAQLSGITEMIGMFRAVMFAPSHLSIVDGGPSVRRNFMDVAISQLSPLYLRYLARYNRCLMERNRAIKDMSFGFAPGKEFWEAYAEQMSTYAAPIAAMRHEYMEMISVRASEIVSEISDSRETAEIEYISSVNKYTGNIENGKLGKIECDASELRDQLTCNLDREVKNGATLFGIHKDDIQIKLSGRDIKTYGSQGQRKSVAIALKLSEGEVANEVDGEYPVMLLDDVFSELDMGRREYIMSKLKNRQVIVTSCEPGFFKSNKRANYINVANGKVIKEK